MPAIVPPASSGVQSARERRETNDAVIEIQWQTAQVQDSLGQDMQRRLLVAAALVQSAVVKNISDPVTKGTGPRGGQVIMNRSVEGEYPKADTTNLMKQIIHGVDKNERGEVVGFVGTTVHYGLILETRMGRLMLASTLAEKASEVRAILTKPVKK